MSENAPKPGAGATRDPKKLDTFGHCILLGAKQREERETPSLPRASRGFFSSSFYLSLIAAFGLGSMVYNGMELGSFFEIPWNSPCYQVLRGINPILQMIFTFSQLYFVFMNARVRRRINFRGFFIELL